MASPRAFRHAAHEDPAPIGSRTYGPSGGVHLAPPRAVWHTAHENPAPIGRIHKEKEGGRIWGTSYKISF